MGVPRRPKNLERKSMIFEKIFSRGLYEMLFFFQRGIQYKKNKKPGGLIALFFLTEG